MSFVTAIVPARNESERIADTVRALLRFCDEVFVIDDGSTDATCALAREAGARTFRLDRSRGKGAAMRAGIRAAGQADFLVFVDGDLGNSAAAIEAALDAIVSGAADLAIAAPGKGAPSGFGLVEAFARRGIKALTGVKVSRPLSGQRAMRYEVARRITIADGFAVETAMTIDALRAGWRVLEIPIEFTHRHTGRTAAGFSHRAKQGAAVASAIARRSLHKRPRGGMVKI